MLFTVSLTVRRDASLALDPANYRAAPNYLGLVHRAIAVNLPDGAAPTYHLETDAAQSFEMVGDALRATAALAGGGKYTVTLAVRIPQGGAYASGYADAAVEVAVLTARGLSAAVVNPGRKDVVLTFGDSDVSGLIFFPLENDSGITVLTNGKISLTTPARVDTVMTLLAGATGDYLGTLRFAASVTVRKAFASDEVIELSPDVKVADGYRDVLATIEARMAKATLRYENLPEGSALTLISDAGKLLLSVAGGSLVGGGEYQLTATLTATAQNYQPRAFTLFATVTALAKRPLYQKNRQPGPSGGNIDDPAGRRGGRLDASVGVRTSGRGRNANHSRGRSGFLTRSGGGGFRDFCFGIRHLG